VNEADTCRRFVVPLLQAAGWDDEPHSIAEQRSITDGRIVPVGRGFVRKPPKRVDYLLRVTRDLPLAVVEAKAGWRNASDGIQQARDYAEMLGLKFAFSTNGHEIVEIDYFTGAETTRSDFPTPSQLLQRYRDASGLSSEADSQRLLEPYNLAGGKPPRYYQRIAIDRAVEAILGGRTRLLLALATGTGKTSVAFQICWKLWTTRWNRSGEPRRPKVLFLADRNFLVDDPMAKDFAPFGDARHKERSGRAQPCPIEDVVGQPFAVRFDLDAATARCARRHVVDGTFDRSQLALIAKAPGTCNEQAQPIEASCLRRCLHVQQRSHQLAFGHGHGKVGGLQGARPTAGLQGHADLARPACSLDRGHRRIGQDVVRSLGNSQLDDIADLTPQRVGRAGLADLRRVAPGRSGGHHACKHLVQVLLGRNAEERLWRRETHARAGRQSLTAECRRAPEVGQHLHQFGHLTSVQGFEPAIVGQHAHMALGIGRDDNHTDVDALGRNEIGLDLDHEGLSGLGTRQPSTTFRTSQHFEIHTCLP
jgi:Type III restriction enzyme, res subunit